jgi:regulator of replication initiation timing
VTDQEQLEQAIHRATFGYRLTSDDTAALLRAYMRVVGQNSRLNQENDNLRAQLESEREMNAILTAETTK